MMPSGWLVLGSVVVFFGGAIWGVVKGRVIYATKIDKQNVQAGGAGKEFLAGLPELPN
jgi:hypothetical protein